MYRFTYWFVSISLYVARCVARQRVTKARWREWRHPTRHGEGARSRAKRVTSQWKRGLSPETRKESVLETLLRKVKVREHRNRDTVSFSLRLTFAWRVISPRPVRLSSVIAASFDLCQVQRERKLLGFCYIIAIK